GSGRAVTGGALRARRTRTSRKGWFSGGGCRIDARSASSSVAGTGVGIDSKSSAAIRQAGRIIDPEIVEVEPVVGCLPCIMLQPAGVTLNVAFEGGLASGARQLDAFGEQLDMQFMAALALVESDAQADRQLQDRCHQVGRHRKPGGITEEGNRQP